MDLQSVDGKLTGHYTYAGKNSAIYLGGKIDVDGTFAMEEGGGLAKRSGIFNGKLHGPKIGGVWQSPDGTRKLPFVADQTSEIIIGSKREI